MLIARLAQPMKVPGQGEPGSNESPRNSTLGLSLNSTARCAGKRGKRTTGEMGEGNVGGGPIRAKKDNVDENTTTKPIGLCASSNNNIFFI